MSIFARESAFIRFSSDRHWKGGSPTRGRRHELTVGMTTAPTRPPPPPQKPRRRPSRRRNSKAANMFSIPTIVMNKRSEACLRKTFVFKLLEGGDQKQLIVEDTSSAREPSSTRLAPANATPDSGEARAARELFDQSWNTMDEMSDTAHNRRMNWEDAIFEASTAAAMRSRRKIRALTSFVNDERIVIVERSGRLWTRSICGDGSPQEGICLRGYAQQDPLVAIRRNRSRMFEAILHDLPDDGIYGWAKLPTLQYCADAGVRDGSAGDQQITATTSASNRITWTHDHKHHPDLSDG